VILLYNAIDLQAQNFEYALSQQEFEGSTISTLLINKEKVILGGGIGSCMRPAFWVFDTTGNFLHCQSPAIDEYGYGFINGIEFDSISQQYFMTARVLLADDVPAATTFVYSFDHEFNPLSTRNLFPYRSNGGIAKIQLPFLIAGKEDSILVYNQRFEEIHRIQFDYEDYRNYDTWLFDSLFIVFNKNESDPRITIYNWKNELLISKKISGTDKILFVDHHFFTLGLDKYLRKYSFPELKTLDSIAFDEEGVIEVGNGHLNSFEIISHNLEHTYIDLFDTNLHLIQRMTSGLEGESEIQGFLNTDIYYHTGKYHSYQPDPNWNPNFYAIIPFLRKIKLNDKTIVRKNLQISSVNLLSHPSPSSINTTNEDKIWYYYDSSEPTIAEITIQNTTNAVLENFAIYKDILGEINCVLNNGYHYISDLEVLPGDSITILDTTYLRNIIESRGLIFYAVAPNHLLSDSSHLGFSVKDQIVPTLERQIGTDFKIYPNPVKDLLYIDNIENIQQAEIDIISIDGRNILSVKYTQEYINVHDFEPGIYFLRIRDQSAVCIKPFVKVE
ncbi:MAG: T9SS type A sorting domain-containing protein, partial [Saprospiraceae bacterium]|nr:T9SS type A sorting domain-containing protein [Saprospiraceae bacterium]